MEPYFDEVAELVLTGKVKRQTKMNLVNLFMLCSNVVCFVMS